MKKKYILNGLDCAHCAQKIADKINSTDGVISADLNFTTKTLSINANHEKVFEKCKDIVTSIEPDVKVKDFDDTSNDEDEKISLVNILLVLFGVSVFIIGSLVFTDILKNIAIIIAYLLISHKIIINLLKKIKNFDFFDENFLMVVASLGAVIIGESLEGIAVMLFFQIGEIAQQKAVNNSRKSISSLMAIKPDTARLVKDGFEAIYAPEEIKVGSVIKVLPGERIPLEGVILSGETQVDKSALTGESIPETARIGDEVLSGSINKSAVITVKVTKPYAESTVAKILDLVENASEKKAKSENFITKFAHVYTPIVVSIAVLLGVIGSIISGNAADWCYRALSFLVVSCPCALVLSIPLCYFCSIGAGAKNGILIKGGNYLEALTKVDTVVFDKTGTLTTGKFKIGEILPQNGFTKEDVLTFASAAESGSNHPIAKSVSTIGKFDKTMLESVEEIAASGVKAIYNGKTVLVGSKRLLKEHNIVFNESDTNCVYVAVNNKFAGIITIEDDIKENSYKAVKNLKNQGIKQIIMLTGDNKAAAVNTAEKLGLDNCKYELLPEDKANVVENLSKQSSVAFIGDGINDAPVIALSDVGIAMGNAGSDSAIEAADVVLMNDNPLGVASVLSLARKTKLIVWQNIIFSLGIKLIIMILSALGVSGIMWAAVFADVGVALLAVLNSMRLLKFQSSSLHAD